MSPFARILKTAVEATPRAIGGAFAAADGEMVDAYATTDPTDWALLTAHYGVVLAHLEAAFNTWHFGGPEFFFVEHPTLGVLVQPVGEGYFALMAVQQPAPLATALTTLGRAVIELRREMG
ncbi:MAG: hypothetical protein H6709_24525 [Kofleriaceae bacterium]|nr:hypothetical protein [Myxococcales bacterium]MCB9564894.1 hypothetical protein [Kofleriaceae bacterium]MCB9575256.1 hypothetical protein [Kofleriaceae bacterium]